MQINVTSDYAIRCLLFLAMSSGIRTSAEISAQMNIPRQYVINIMHKLKRHGFVLTQEGVRGGYRLAMAPKEITLLDVLQAIEGTMKISRCLEEDRFCSRLATETCPMRKCYEGLQHSLEAMLQAQTLQRILDMSEAE